MQITVKSTKVLKTGTNQYGDWKLVQITTAEDVKYTTLAKEADMIPSGSTINITDMDKDEQGRESFKKFSITNKGKATSPVSGDDSPEKRKSIENQTRAYIIADLYKAEKLEADSSQVVSLLAWLDKLDSPTSSIKAETTIPAEGEDWPPLKDLGQLLTRAHKYGISSRDVCESVGVGKPEEIIDLDEAWKATAKRFAAAIKAVTEATN